MKNINQHFSNASAFQGKRIAKTLSYGHVQFLKRLDSIFQKVLSHLPNSAMKRLFGTHRSYVNGDRVCLIFQEEGAQCVCRGDRPSATYRYLRDLFSRPPHSGITKHSSILVIRPGGIGDAVLLIPVLKALRDHFPGARISILAERRNASVLRPAVGSIVDELMCYDNFRDVLSLFTRSFEIVIDTEQWHVLSALVGRLLARRKGIQIGFATNDRKLLLSCAVTYDDEGFEGDNFFRLLEPLGIGFSSPRPYSAFYPAFSEGNPSKHNQVAIFPGASIKERRWDPERFHDVAKWLLSKNMDVVIVGGKEDLQASEEIARGLPQVRNLAGKTSLDETAKILALSRLLISSDSGIMHLAVAVGTPVVALFGSGIESKWAPRDGVSIVINKRLPCSPCTRYGYTIACPRNARCIMEISADEVIAAANRILFGDR